MAIALRGSEELGGLRTGINPQFIYPTSRMVSDFTGMVVQPHKAIVGANAFAHESGIHQDGMLKNANTYEIMSPESIGMSRDQADVGVVLGKHSGRNALSSKLHQMGIDMDGEALNDVFKRFKELCDKKKRVHDEDVLALVSDKISQVLLPCSSADLYVVFTAALCLQRSALYLSPNPGAVYVVYGTCCARCVGVPSCSGEPC